MVDDLVEGIDIQIEQLGKLKEQIHATVKSVFPKTDPVLEVKKLISDII